METQKTGLQGGIHDRPTWSLKCKQAVKEAYKSGHYADDVTLSVYSDIAALFSGIALYWFEHHMVTLSLRENAVICAIRLIET